MASNTLTGRNLRNELSGIQQDLAEEYDDDWSAVNADCIIDTFWDRMKHSDVEVNAAEVRTITAKLVKENA